MGGFEPKISGIIIRPIIQPYHYTTLTRHICWEALLINAGALESMRHLVEILSSVTNVFNSTKLDSLAFFFLRPRLYGNRG